MSETRTKIVKKVLNLVLLFVLTLFNSCLLQDYLVNAQIQPKTEHEANFKRHFDKLAINGSIIIYDRYRKKFYQHNPIRNNTAFLPASTYKIPHSLIALETGVIKNDVDVLTWDGIKRGFGSSPYILWNQDLNLRLAFKYSAVWFYQVLARRIGHQRMQDFINQIEYGNQNIGNIEDIDRFWLEGELTITPKQQIGFLLRLYNNDLPFSQGTINLVKDIAIAEQTANYVLRAKTGATSKIGWYVGYLEQNEHVYFFATNLDINSNNALTARSEVTRRCLRDLGLL